MTFLSLFPIFSLSPPKYDITSLEAGNLIHLNAVAVEDGTKISPQCGGSEFVCANLLRRTLINVREHIHNNKANIIPFQH